jgi:hypothetical protein
LFRQHRSHRPGADTHLVHSLTHSLTHTNTQTHSLTHTRTNTHTHTDKHTHSSHTCWLWARACSFASFPQHACRAVADSAIDIASARRVMQLCAVRYPFAPHNPPVVSLRQARGIADGALKLWHELLADLDDDAQRGELQRSMGMKMEQLKAESQQLLDRLSDH